MEKEKKPVYKRWWFWVIIVLVVIVIIGSVGGGSGSDSATNAEPVESDTGDGSDTGTVENATDAEAAEEAEEAEESGDIVTVGSTFVSGDLQITIDSADTDYTDYKDDYGIYAPDEGMKYVKVSFTVENIGDSGDKYVSIYDFDCYADNTACDQNFMIDSEDFVNTNLSAGRNVSFSTYYSVPVDAKSIELEYTENRITGSKVTIVIQ